MVRRLPFLNVTYVRRLIIIIKVKKDNIRYNTSYEKYKSDILTSNITSNTLVLMGSSRLVATIMRTIIQIKIFNYNDF